MPVFLSRQKAARFRARDPEEQARLRERSAYAQAHGYRTTKEMDRAMAGLGALVFRICCAQATVCLAAIEKSSYLVYLALTRLVTPLTTS